MARRDWREREEWDCATCGRGFEEPWHCSLHPRYHPYAPEEPPADLEMQRAEKQKLTSRLI